ncbi:MAG: cation-translocating P-type ATPase [Bacteroidia bacterium]|nr:cation-translocating P-type ATPase [Bacteroidia bacterium]
MSVSNFPSQFKGLTDEELQISRDKYGYNQVEAVKERHGYRLLLDILKEPMLILLMAVAVIYLITGDYAEAVFMAVAIVAVSAISFYQDNRSQKALKELKQLNEPFSTVIRNSRAIQIPTHEIAVGDLCITEEGKLINADGKIVYSNDFSVNESSLTGESFSVFKDSNSENNRVYSGTITVSGLAIFEVENIGRQARIGKLGESIQSIAKASSPLQLQIERFVRGMAVIGIIIFVMVCSYSFFRSHDLLKSLLNGLTLAMSILPEEIPVAFTTFMSLGAWKLMNEGIIIKRSNIVETLGSTTVICTDKTGTITENSMHLKYLYDYRSNQLYNEKNFNTDELAELISYAMWASEPVPFDPMEMELHKVYGATRLPDQRKSFRMIHEYPLDGVPPMMTHLFENDESQRIIAAKGAPEAILAVSELSDLERARLKKQIRVLGCEGYRVLGVAKSSFEGTNYPAKQQDLKFTFLGFTVFYDPPKKGISEVFRKIYDAGIQVKVITGDNPDTTRAIAAKAGIKNYTPMVSGEQIVHLTEERLIPVVEKTTIFTRMFPEAKLAIVNALKQKGEVVAMLGDGVNDGPALKSAHIGVAMGHKGTEIAKAAASLVITNDDLDKLITGIAQGRRIYTNLKKAIQYIISIHIPIILTVSLPLFLGWVFPQIFTPVHVIFLELVMGPTCSIVYENEPMEKNAMQQPPRILSATFLNWHELTLSIVQGLMITAGVLFAYQWSVYTGGNETKTRAMVFSTMIFANILLSFSNRSFYFSLIESFRMRNNLLVGITVLTIAALFLILYVESFSQFFRLTALSLTELVITLTVAIASVLWFEIYKLVIRLKTERSQLARKE